jgi:carbonic anhydrase/acetyltransferase-like protein (isoleucine patch superfamily)
VEKDLYPTFLEDDVVLPPVVVHGVESNGLSHRIGAIVLNGRRLGESIVGAGSVVTPRTIIPPRTLALGSPARPVRPLEEKDIRMIQQAVRNYRPSRDL